MSSIPKVEPRDILVDKEKFERDGFLVVPNAFTREEMEAIRKRMKDMLHEFDAEKTKSTFDTGMCVFETRVCVSCCLGRFLIQWGCFPSSLHGVFKPEYMLFGFFVNLVCSVLCIYMLYACMHVHAASTVRIVSCP